MTVLVTSTEESTGKTAVALALAAAAEDRGERVGYMKPVGTRPGPAVGETLDEDPALARELLELDAEVREMEPVVYSPTFRQRAVRGREDHDALRRRVTEQFEALADSTDRMVLEGGGTLATGGLVGLADADLAAQLDATALLVAEYEEPSDVDSVLAAAELLGDRLGGVLFNAVPDAAFDTLASDIVPFLERRDIRVYGTVPRDAELAGVSAERLADELGAETLTTGVAAEGHLQRVVVGAMGSEGALEGLGRARDAVLVTGGDRTDVQTAAIAAPGVACLVLTRGVRPARAVIDRAESGGVPVLQVETDTKTTLDRLEGVVQSGRARDAEAVERMGELLTDYADIDAMLGG